MFDNGHIKRLQFKFSSQTVADFNDAVLQDNRDRATAFRATVARSCETDPEQFIAGALEVLTKAVYADDNQRDLLIFYLLTALFRRNKSRSLNDAVDSLCKVIVELVPNCSKSPAFYMLVGARLMLLGDRTGAYAAFGAAADNARDDAFWPRKYLGCHSIRPYVHNPEWTETIPCPPYFSPISFHAGKPRGPVVVSATCDGNYFCNLAEYLLLSIDSTDSTSDIHFHVINWTAQCAEVLSSMRLITGRNILISSENYEFSKDYTYFATCRFLRAAEFLAHFDRPLYLTDMDNRMVAAPEQTEDLLKRDFGVRNNDWNRWIPWLGPNAGSVFINNTEHGGIFADNLSQYVRSRFIVNSRRSWYFDQLCLNEVAEAIMATPAKFRDLSRGKQYSAARPAIETQFLKNGR